MSPVYHGDGVAHKVCHVHKAVVGVEGNAIGLIPRVRVLWPQRCLSPVYHGDGVAIEFVTYKWPLLGLKAMPAGFEPTDMVSMTNPCGALVSVTWYVMGNGGFIISVVPLSEPSNEIEDPLPVVAVMLNKSAAGQSATVEVKLQTTSLLTVKVLVVGVGGRRIVAVVTAGCCGMFLLWSLKPKTLLSLPSVCSPSFACSQPSSLLHRLS